MLFGYLGDRLGRKDNFLITITMMGMATAGGVCGLCRDRNRGAGADRRDANPPGLALGGEYGGRHLCRRTFAGRAQRFHTSFIQASVVGGFRILPWRVLGARCTGRSMGDGAAAAVPLLRFVLLGNIAVDAAQHCPKAGVQGDDGSRRDCRNPFVESFNLSGNRKRRSSAVRHFGGIP